MQNREHSSISHVLINVETTSKVDLNESTLDAFSSHADTQIVVVTCTFRRDSGTEYVTYSIINSKILKNTVTVTESKKCWQLLQDASRDRALFIAHNASFVRSLFTNKLSKIFDKVRWLDTMYLAQEVKLELNLFKLADNLCIEHEVDIKKYKKIISDFCISTSTQILCCLDDELHDLIKASQLKVEIVRKIWYGIPKLHGAVSDEFEAIYQMNQATIPFNEKAIAAILKKHATNNSLYFKFLKTIYKKLKEGRYGNDRIWVPNYFKFEALSDAPVNYNNCLIPENLPGLIKTSKMFYIFQFNFDTEKTYNTIIGPRDIYGILCKEVGKDSKYQRLSSVQLPYNISIIKIENWLSIQLPGLKDLLYYQPTISNSTICHLAAIQNDKPIKIENSVLYQRFTLDALKEDLPHAIARNIQFEYIKKLKEHLPGLVFMNDNILIFECATHEAHDIHKYVENMPSWVDAMPFELYYIRNNVAIDNVRCSKKIYKENLLHS